MNPSVKNRDKSYQQQHGKENHQLIANGKTRHQNGSCKTTTLAGAGASYVAPPKGPQAQVSQTSDTASLVMTPTDTSCWDQAEILTLELDCSTVDFKLLKLNSSGSDDVDSSGKIDSAQSGSDGRGDLKNIINDASSNNGSVGTNNMRQTSTQTDGGRGRRCKSAKRSRSFPLKLRRVKAYSTADAGDNSQIDFQVIKQMFFFNNFF